MFFARAVVRVLIAAQLNAAAGRGVPQGRLLRMDNERTSEDQPETVRTRGPACPLRAAALIATKAATLLFAADAVIHPDAPRFHGKAMRLRAIAYVGSILAVPAVWLARGRAGPYPVDADLIVTTPILLDAGGNSLGVYDQANIDDIVHFVNAAILMTGFGILTRDRVESRMEAAALIVGMGMAGEALWEVMEFVGYKLGYRGMGLTYEDTMADTIESLAGSALGAVIAVMRWDQRLHERLEPRVEVAAGA